VIISLRGTHSSGKTYVMRSLLAKFVHAPVYGVLGPRKPEAYLLHRLNKNVNPIYVLGPYDDTPTSGVDQISPAGFAGVIALIEKYRKKGHVVMEGIHVSKCFGSIGEYLVQHKDELIVAHLNTPLETCLSDLRKRQAKSRRKREDGGGDKHIARGYKDIIATCNRFKEHGVRVEEVSRDNAVEKILSWLS
jgi:hypothetical protein